MSSNSIPPKTPSDESINRVCAHMHFIVFPVATLPGAWRYRVSTGTGRPGVSIL